MTYRHLLHNLRRCSASCTLSLALLAVPAILSVPSASAQLSGKGSINGTVTDPSGAVVPNAVIVATSTTRGIKLTAKSGSAGEYTISPLDPDIYTLSITAQGFQTVTQENLHVNALEVTDVPVSLPLGLSSETVTVSSAPPAIEGSNATLGGTLEQETYSQLPIQMGAYGQDGARRATDFVALLPGVQFNETNGNATTNTGVVNGGGARGAVSDVYINGTPFISAAGQGDPRFVWSAFGVDSVNQLQVQTTGYSAQYEGQGVQNYTIKSGTNTFHGSAYEYFRNTALDTFSYFDKGTQAIDPIKGKLVKPAEHQNEYGGTLGGPVLRNKAFFFANFNKYNLTRGPKHIFQTIPTLAAQSGDFSGITQVVNGVTVPVHIYDPASCPNGNTGSTGTCQRTQFPGDKIPASRLSQAPQVQAMQKFLNATPPTNNQQINNYLSGYNSGLSNYTGTGRFDYTITSKHSVSFVVGIGSQSTTGPSRQTSLSASNNALPAPYISVQQFNPKTKVGMVEETWIISPRAVNQFKYGFARYEGSGFNQSYLPQYAASTAIGISGLPSGQAAGSFPKVTFNGTAAPNQWAGYTDNHQATNAYTLVDNFNFIAGKHSLTAGVQISWLQYNYQAQSGGSTPLALTFSSAQTGCYSTSSAVSSTGVATCTTGSANVNTLTGLPYASFLLGAVNNASFTTTTVIETGARFRPISPYIQDDYKVTPKLTVNIGLRWDYYPPFREVQNRLSFLDLNATNSVTGTKGALAFAGTGNNAAFCNCNTNVKNWYKNFGPRLGFAYSLTPRTVIRSSYGVIFAHGNGTGGSAISRQGSGQLGYAASPSFVSAGASVPAFYLQNGIPSYTAPPFFTSTYGTGYNTTPGFTGAPQTVSYGDPYYGDRAPQFLNWSFGIQQAFTNNLTLTASYVGSQGHFLQADTNNARGSIINQLDPKYLALGGTVLAQRATVANLAAAGLTLPYATFDQTQTIAKALAPLPQYNSVTDSYGAVANSNYHALQTSLNQRFSSGMSFMINYTWAKNIDDAGSFRSGYAIPGFATTTGQAFAVNRIDRSLSLADRRHNLVVTGVFESPFGKRIFSNSAWTRRLAGGFRLSTIFTAYTGSPLAITSATSNINPSQSQASPSYNPNYSGTARKNGKWGDGITADTASNPANGYLDSNAFVATPDYKFSVLPRTGAYGLTGPGNYNLDLSLRRAFAMPMVEALRLTLQGDLYNTFNHTQFGGINTSYGNAAFGTVTSQANQSRDAQLSARFEF